MLALYDTIFKYFEKTIKYGMGHQCHVDQDIELLPMKQYCFSFFFRFSVLADSSNLLAVSFSILADSFNVLADSLSVLTDSFSLLADSFDRTIKQFYLRKFYCMMLLPV